MFAKLRFAGFLALLVSLVGFASYVFAQGNPTNGTGDCEIGCWEIKCWHKATPVPGGVIEKTCYLYDESFASSWPTWVVPRQGGPKKKKHPTIVALDDQGNIERVNYWDCEDCVDECLNPGDADPEKCTDAPKKIVRLSRQRRLCTACPSN